MAEQRVQRRLAAILAADVVGYSRLMEADEAGTLTRLKELRREVFDPKTKQYGGRIFKTTGDGALVEFKSAADAVDSALEIQGILEERNRDVSQDWRIELRVGISLGDVIVEGGDLYGNGVNVAARMEGLATTGGICISANVQEHVRGADRVAFEDLGEQKVKNIDRPIKAYRVRLESGGAELVAPRSDQPLALPDKPSIAVLPFTNMSSDPEQEHFGVGLAEDIITTLSHISNLFVIARNSSFAFKGQAVDVRKVAADLGVRYVLEGSVRAAGNRLRITAQLIDAIDGHHLWSERFDRRMDDIFAIQDEIMREIVTGLRLKILDHELPRIWFRGTDNVEAWSYCMQGMDLLQQGAANSSFDGRSMLQRAIDIDPDYVMAHAFIGMTHYMDRHFGYTDDPVRSMRLALEFSERALASDPDCTVALMVKGLSEILLGPGSNGIHMCRRAVDLAPSDATLKMFLARALAFLGGLGELAEAEGLLRQAIRLSPFRGIHYFGILANVLEMQGRDDEAIPVLNQALAKNPDYFAGHVRLASLLGLAGRLDDARLHLAEARRTNPRFGRHSLADFYPTKNEAARQRFIKGLDAAGLDLT